MNKRINAFTLIEMVLAMMLAAIVIGMVYSAFSLFSKLYGGYHSKNLAHAEVRMLKQVLEHDVANAAFVEVGEEGIQFKDSTGLSTLNYHLGEDILIRSGREAVLDTFKFKSLIIQALFEGAEINRGIADRIIFSFEYERAPMLVSAAKKYTSTDLFNYQSAQWKQ